MSTDPIQFFTEVFVSLTGRAPYPWQLELFLDIVGERWPQVLNLPTGSGKTAVLQIWLAALAWSLQNGTSGVPRRLAWVVNRRVVVDQVTEEVEALVGEEGALDRCPAIRDLLASASLRGIPLAVSTLRGQRAGRVQNFKNCNSLEAR
jgi:CRISPR-associated endonuclease/helicase Cas3